MLSAKEKPNRYLVVVGYRHSGLYKVCHKIILYTLCIKRYNFKIQVSMYIIYLKRDKWSHTATTKWLPVFCTAMGNKI
jgi:hypothetical protein